MELRQLEYFVAVAEEASFTKAAVRVRVAQPGISAQIRQLERELGQDLLDRSGRQMRLTQVGEAVLPYARAALEAVAGVQLAVDELTGLMRGRVAVGMVVACSALDLPGLLADFHRDHPAVEITLSQDNSDRLIADLQSGHLDIALVGLAGTTPPGIETLLVTEEPLTAAVSPTDPLATTTEIPLEAIRERPLISLPRGTGIRMALENACATVGFEPQIAFEANDPHLLVQLASQGLGVAILTESMAKAHPTELHTTAITRPRIPSRLTLAWRAEGPISPAARVLIRHARSALAGL